MLSENGLKFVISGFLGRNYEYLAVLPKLNFIVRLEHFVKWAALGLFALLLFFLLFVLTFLWRVFLGGRTAGSDGVSG